MLALHQPDLWQQQCLINGQWVDGCGDQCIAVEDPASGARIGSVPSLERGDVERAVAAAQTAFRDWSATAAAERGAILSSWYRALLANEDDLARIMTLEQGKPLAEARGEVRYAASYLKWFAGEAERTYGDVIPAAAADQTIRVIKQPVGVCASITPWNFPIAMLARKVAAALAAGCTMVSKPAALTPFSALAFAQLGQQAGLPDGTFNVLTGASEMMGEVFTQHPAIKKISFTGSTQVGKLLVEKSAHHVQKLSLELGGNAPFIVFEDADLERALDGLMAAKFRNTGQTCICVNRLFIQQSVYDTFMARLRERMAAMKVGNGFDDGVVQGPLINAAAVDKSNRHINDALEKGAKLELGGPVEHSGEGYFVQPTLLSNATHAMQFCNEETFAPVLAGIPFDNEAEVLTMANDTPYGLASYFYSEDYRRIRRVSDALEAGMVGANDSRLSNAAAPFGGVKESGYGREGSQYGLDDYVAIKYILEGY